MKTTTMMKIDKLIKIEGTEYDTRRKMSPSMIKLARELRASGKTYAYIAGVLGVSIYTVEYYTNEKFAAQEKVRLAERNRKTYYKNKEHINQNHKLAFTKRVNRKLKIVTNLVLNEK